MHKHIYTYIYIYINIYIYIKICIYQCIYVCINIQTYIYTDIFIHTYVANTCTCIYHIPKREKGGSSDRASDRERDREQALDRPGKKDSPRDSGSEPVSAFLSFGGFGGENPCCNICNIVDASSFLEDELQDTATHSNSGGASNILHE